MTNKYWPTGCTELHPGYITANCVHTCAMFSTYKGNLQLSVFLNKFMNKSDRNAESG